MGSHIVKACTWVVESVRSIISSVSDWLKSTIEPKVEIDVKKANNLIVTANNSETTGKYVTAVREKHHLDYEINNISKNMTTTDRKNANTFLSTFNFE